MIFSLIQTVCFILQGECMCTVLILCVYICLLVFFCDGLSLWYSLFRLQDGRRGKEQKAKNINIKAKHVGRGLGRGRCKPPPRSHPFLRHFTIAHVQSGANGSIYYFPIQLSASLEHAKSGIAVNEASEYNSQGCPQLCK